MSLSPRELELLRLIRDRKPIPTGAVSNASLERLRNSGYITDYVGKYPLLKVRGSEAIK